MVLIDSSVWVAYFYADDAHHAKAKKIIDEADYNIVMPYCVLSEVASVLTYKGVKDRANMFVETSINNQNVEIINHYYLGEALYFLSFNSKMSFQDYAIASIAKNGPYKLITFDKQLEKFVKNELKHRN